MKCYLINLDRAPERLARMTELLGCHEIEFERVAAIDARNFTAKELETYRKQRTEGHELAPGDIACGATHLSILKRIVEGNEKYAVVIEDDVHFSSDIRRFLTETDWIPGGADIVKLETFRERTIIDAQGVRLSHDRSIHRLHSAHGGTALFVISKEAAQRILDLYTPGIECIDIYLFKDKISEFKIYQVTPAPAIQDNIAGFYSQPYLSSDITSQRVFAKQKKPKGIKKINRELFRLSDKFNALLLYFWMRVFKGRKYGKIPFK